MSWFWGRRYKALYRIFAAFSDIPIPHDAGDFSLMYRRVVGWLLNCPECDLFVRGLRAYVGFRQTGVDVVRQLAEESPWCSALERPLQR
jgi:dolichol-phosphate mannosyltransferase